MKLISDRDILEARAVLMREIEAGRITEPLSKEDVKREKEQRRKKLGVSPRFKAWREANPEPVKNPMLPGEIPLKVYIEMRAAKEGIPKHTLFSRLIRSNYEGVPIRRVNARVIFVQMEPQTNEQNNAH